MIYLDNSATTYPKPLSVLAASNQAIRHYGFNSGRGGYKQSIATASKIYDVRYKLANMFSFSENNVAFTHNCTLALNIAIKGLVKKSDHILISNLEHNAVARPVKALSDKGIITFDVFEYSYDNDVVIRNIKDKLKSNTSLIVCTQASNVFGFSFPIEEISALARERGIFLVVDGAQGAGVLSLDNHKNNITAYCIAGHKGLYGLMSTGALMLGDDVSVDTIIEGGTGSSSLILSQPEAMPDRMESGSLNNSGIISLGAGIDFVNKKGVDNIYKHELELVRYIYAELEHNEDVTLYTPAPEYNKAVPVLSFNYKDYPSEKTAMFLADYNIAVRSGYHCSPLAHTSLGTIGRGTVRVSPCVFTTQYECEKFLNTLKKL